MHKRLEEIQASLPAQHKDIVKFTHHTFEALVKLEEEHVRVRSLNSQAGIDPDPDEEAVFTNTMYQIKKLLLQELEKTADDLLHAYDKGHLPHYKDGVKE